MMYIIVCVYTIQYIILFVNNHLFKKFISKEYAMARKPTKRDSFRCPVSAFLIMFSVGNNQI